jgi:hypothetical protein
VVRRFVERRIVRSQDLPRFDSAIESAVRLRNSIAVELGLLFVVYTFGLWLWNSRVRLDTSTWYADLGGRWNFTPQATGTYSLVFRSSSSYFCGGTSGCLSGFVSFGRFPEWTCI